MSLENQKNSSENENLCVLCFKPFEIYSVGICEHAVCYECSTRMRVLCKQNECPICRGDMPRVIFTNDIEPFTTLFSKYSKTYLQDDKAGLIFASSEIQRAYNKLMEHRCQICEGRTYKTFGQLKDHMRREHELFYCDICEENVRIFSSERRCYNRQELGMHRRKGDPDNTSHRGHPLCEFCDTRFMDSDELFRHMRRVHFFCHFCDADGRHLYYKSFEDLQKHFRDEHYLCEEGECKSIPMASAFRTEIDLKAHIAAIHGRNLGKNASKQIRTLELAFTLAPRNNSRNNHNNNNRIDEEGAVGYEPGGPGGGYENIFHKPLTPNDFPALGGSSGNISTVPPPSQVFASKTYQKLNMNDFPTLGGGNRPSSSNVTITSKNSEVSISRKNDFPALGKPSTSRESRVTLSVHNNQNSKTPQVSIQVNQRPNGFQITTTTAPSAQQNAQKRVEAFPALGNAGKSNSTELEWVRVKTKKPAEKQHPKVAPPPKLPPSDLTQFPNLTKGKSNTKKTSIQVPVSNDWVNLNALKKESKNSGNLEIRQNTSDDKNKTSGKKKKGKSSASNVPETAPITVQSENNGHVPKPPPGFTLPPPPGFQTRTNDFPCLGLPNDLTFTTSSGESYAITSRANNYKQPANFSARNQNIIKKLSMVSGNDTVNDFKVRSDMFRNGQWSPDKYYAYCKKVLSGNFEDFFTELLVLLPDIEKQQALYNVHNGKSKKNLEVCQNCKQVILKKELSEHYKYHVFDNQFSSQSQVNNINNNNNIWNK